MSAEIKARCGYCGRPLSWPKVESFSCIECEPLRGADLEAIEVWMEAKEAKKESNEVANEVAVPKAVLRGRSRDR